LWETEKRPKINCETQCRCNHIRDQKVIFRKEITLALENEFVAVTLGTTRLRTETAAIVACHSVVL
jgi:hypothetical protein